MSTGSQPAAEPVSLPRALAIAAMMGAAGAVVALAFVAVVSAGQSVLWPDPLDPSAFSGSIKIVIALTLGGLVVGIIHTLVPSAQEDNVFVALATGRIQSDAIPGGVAIAVVSLIAGFSLGPEVPTGMAAAGIAAFAVATARAASRLGSCDECGDFRCMGWAVHRPVHGALVEHRVGCGTQRDAMGALRPMPLPRSWDSRSSSPSTPAGRI